jgi:diaminopimelate decarboxylase
MCFNVESMPELERLDQVARSLGTQAPVSLRVNPDVDPKTHPYISTGLKENKFGIPIEMARAAYRKAASLAGVRITGVDYHIGSQITELEPFLDALDKLLDLVDALKADGITLHHLDLGGGLGIRYAEETPPAASELLQALFARIDARDQGHHTIVFEPGRSLVGNAGVLLTRVEYVKPTQARNFVIVDAAMNDLLRPTLYSAWHGVVPVAPRNEAPLHCDVVGPVCESGDWLARDRQLAVREGDLLAIESVGAYGMVMASNYNSRPRAAEIMVDGNSHHLIRHRETIEDLFAGECLLP